MNIHKTPNYVETCTKHWITETTITSHLTDWLNTNVFYCYLLFLVVVPVLIAELVVVVVVPNTFDTKSHYKFIIYKSS